MNFINYLYIIEILFHVLLDKFMVILERSFKKLHVYAHVKFTKILMLNFVML